MIVIDAIWEKRNIGVSTLEVSVEESDDLDDDLKRIIELNADYIVIKVPTSLGGFTWRIQDLGYVYVEDLVHLESKLDIPARTSIEERMYNAISVRPMDGEDIEELIQEVRKGVFDSDRIYLDPFFSSEQASIRYANWIRDEYKNGTQFYNHIYNNDKVAFFSLKEREKGRYYSALGGVYSGFRNGAISSVIKIVDVVKDLGGKSLDTDVSTNNPGQIRNLIRHCYMPKRIMHVFVKHVKKG